ncbi:hypothetical protein CBR_g30653 [Chara braunii]|uniref:Integrase catalytic domain-containing protein n=1 Tax=Chara braunii TaxID=69332 RepID=A0A388LDA3_CHABU|nr:hypothetical protein CBR_g30653 [Chara braunii]|eukprot:GBG80286.1 hypothetical protein CBR_g30653 [Chara braunii]
MVETRSGKETSPYTTEQQEKMAALVRESKERKEREKQAKLKAIADEQAAKMKRLEEEIKKVQQEEEERRKAAEAEAASEEEKERMRIESGEGSSSGTMTRETDTGLEKRISEWVANLLLGEDKEAESYVTKDEKAALAAELAAMLDPMERREREEEQKLAWKLRMKREKKKRREEVNNMTAEVAEVQECRAEVLAQPDDKAKRDKVLGYVLEKLREANFKINAKKCEWAETQVLYLGHVLDGDGIKPEDSKIAAIRDWPTPRALTELRSFLGLANYYRKFVRNFSIIAAPLRRLLKKEAIWQWDKDCTSALKKLKRALIEYPVLKVADPSLPFVVTTDASQYGIGAVLQQDDSNGYRTVEFMSARMPCEKVATSTYERELYALRQALDHWKHYLLGRHFKVYYDHETLPWLKTQAKMTPKLTRWAAEIDQFDFELKPVKGKYNVVADALSRRSDYFGAVVHYLDIGRDLQEKVKQAYTQDPIYNDLLKRVRETPETEPDYRTTDGLLFEKTNVFDRLCVPNCEEIRSLVLGECHDIEGHFGWQKTLANLVRAYTWPGMKNDCIEYVRSCKVCQRNKYTTRAPLGLLRPLPIPDQPGDSVSIDFMDTQVKSRHGLRSLRERVLGWFDPEGTMKVGEGVEAGKQERGSGTIGGIGGTEGGLRMMVFSLTRALNKNQRYLTDAKKRLTFGGVNIIKFLIDYENLGALLRWSEEEKMEHLRRHVSLSLGRDNGYRRHQRILEKGSRRNDEEILGSRENGYGDSASCGAKKELCNIQRFLEGI